MNEIVNTNPSGESPFDAIRRTREDGSHYWSARELMPMLGYDKWERFSDAISRAVASMENVGVNPEQNASRLREPSGKTRGRKGPDVLRGQDPRGRDRTASGAQRARTHGPSPDFSGRITHRNGVLTDRYRDTP